MGQQLIGWNTYLLKASQWLLVVINKDVSRTQWYCQSVGYLKGGVFTPYKVSWCPFVKWNWSWLVKCGHVVWYIHLSWRENVDTWFSTPTVCSSNHVVWDANFCKAKVEWMEHGVELHECHLYQWVSASCKVWVGYDRVAYWSPRCVFGYYWRCLLGTKCRDVGLTWRECTRMSLRDSVLWETVMWRGKGGRLDQMVSYWELSSFRWLRSRNWKNTSRT